MARRRLVFESLITAIAGAALIGAACADDAAPPTQRKILGKMTEGTARHPCTLPNCATVLAVRHQAPWEPSTPVNAHGISHNPGLGPFNPRLPTITQPSSSVQQRKEVWIIEVRKRDGSVQTFRQNYPALVQVGDEVLIQGDRLRVSD